jgi:hypothetical protein
MKVHKMNPMYDLSYPVGNNMEKAKKWVRSAARKFRRIAMFKGKPIQLICRGSSGSVLGTLFISMLPGYEITIYYVRKHSESAHGISQWQENSYNVVIDDLISTGDTLRAIYNAIPKCDIHCLIISNGIERKNSVPFDPLHTISIT